MQRRAFLSSAAAAGQAIAADSPTARRAKRLGLSIASYRRYRSDTGSARFPPWKNALDVLDHCADLGAGCLQIGVHGWTNDFAGKVRDRREALGILLEGQIRLPKDAADVDRFRSECAAAREAGAGILRTVCLSGRRYESMNSLAAWREFKAASWMSLTLAEPVVRNLGLKLAVENHKDWRTDEMADLLSRLASESIGVTFDFGNNLALLEDPAAVCEALAPFLLTTHFKDMDVRPSADGFLLSEVPLGDGLLDVSALIAICENAQPDVQFNLEMITRDPLRVPVLNDKYWLAMPDVPAADLAAALDLARCRAHLAPLPEVSSLSADDRLAAEEENVRRSFAFARSRLRLPT